MFDLLNRFPDPTEQTTCIHQWRMPSQTHVHADVYSRSLCYPKQRRCCTSFLLNSLFQSPCVSKTQTKTHTGWNPWKGFARRPILYVQVKSLTLKGSCTGPVCAVHILKTQTGKLLEKAHLLHFCSLLQKPWQHLLSLRHSSQVWCI